MHYTIPDIKNPIYLQQYLDTRCENKHIAVKSFVYCIGWHNVVGQVFHKTGDSEVHIPDGYYNVLQIDLFRHYKISLSVGDTDGIALLSSPVSLRISDGLKKMLGFDVPGRFSENIVHKGSFPVDFAIVKELYIHMPDDNGSYNFFNGRPSDVLTVVPVREGKFGDIVSIEFHHPVYKRLRNGTITEINLYPKNADGKIVDNNGLPMGCVLEVI